MYQEYGPIVNMPGVFGKSDLIFLFEPQLVEQVCRSEGPDPVRKGLEIYEHYRKIIRPDLFKGMGGLGVDQGKQWRACRTIANPLLMSPNVIKQYLPAVDFVAQQFVKRIKIIRNENNCEMPENFSSELHRWSFKSVASVVMMDLRLGDIIDDNNPENEEIVEVILNNV